MPISLDEYKQQFGHDFTPGESYDKPYGWSDRLGASVDSAQAGLLGVGEAAGLDWGDARRRNQYDSDVVRNAAIRDTGAPERIRDIDGLGSLAKGVAGLAVDSAPQLATSIAAGVATGGWGLALPTAGRLAAGAAAGAPFNMGDILQNQRQEAGQTDLLSAAALTVPYTAADMLGLDSAIATGKFARTGMKALDDMTGWKGLAARGAANTGINALAEGTGETLQEFANQAGRIAVNPNQTFFNPDANERYTESFLGGGLLGGAISAPFSMGRSNGYKPPLPASDTAPGTPAATDTADLLTTSQGFEDIAKPRVDTPNPLGDLTPNWTTQPGANTGPQYEGGIDATDLTRALGEQEPNTGVNPLGGGLQIPAVPGRPGVADAMQVGGTSEVALTDADNAAMQEPGAILARQQYLKQKEEQDAADQIKREAQAKHDALVKDTHATLFTQDELASTDRPKIPHPVFKATTDMNAAKAEGLITDVQHSSLVGELRSALTSNDKERISGAVKNVNTTIKDAKKLAEAQAAMAETKPNAAPKPITAKVVETKPAAPATTAVAPTATAPNAGPATASAGTATQPAAATVAPKAGANAVPAAPIAPAANKPAPVSTVPPAEASEAAAASKASNTRIGKLAGKTAVLGNSIDFGAMKLMLEPLDARLHNAVRMVLGVDEQGNRVAPMSGQAAAEKAGLAKPGKANTEVSRAMNAIGITKAIRNRFWASDASVREHANGDIWGTGEANDTSPEGSEKNTESTGDKNVLGADEYDADHEAAENEYVDDRAVIDTAGGSQSDIAAPTRKRLEAHPLFAKPMAEADNNITRVSHSDLAMMAEVATRHVGNPGNDVAIGAVMQELQRRMRSSEPGVREGAMAAMTDVAKTDVEKRIRDAAKPTLNTETGGIEESDGADESGLGEGTSSESAAKPAVVVKKRRTAVKPDDSETKFSKAVADEPVAVTVTVNGKQLEFGDGGSAMTALNKRLDRYKALLDCLKG